MLHFHPEILKQIVRYSAFVRISALRKILFLFVDEVNNNYIFPKIVLRIIYLYYLKLNPLI